MLRNKLKAQDQRRRGGRRWKNFLFLFTSVSLQYNMNHIYSTQDE